MDLKGTRTQKNLLSHHQRTGESRPWRPARILPGNHCPFERKTEPIGINEGVNSNVRTPCQPQRQFARMAA